MTDTQFSEYFPLGIEPGMIVPYAHKGKWAVHELLPFFFDELGSFHLSLATFNISEESLRPIFFMKDRGELLSARFLFDTNIRRHKIDMLLFARSVADDIRLSSSHMKVMLCCNDFTSIAVVGSANMLFRISKIPTFESNSQQGVIRSINGLLTKEVSKLIEKI